VKKFDDIFSRVDTIHQRDRRTDRQDTGRQQRPRLRRAVKNGDYDLTDFTAWCRHCTNKCSSGWATQPRSRSVQNAYLIPWWYDVIGSNTVHISVHPAGCCFFRSATRYPVKRTYI